MPQVELNLHDNPNFIHQRRWVFGKAVGLLLHSEIIDPNKNLQKTEEMLKDGIGIFVVFRHFSERDPMQLVKDFAESGEVMRRVDCTAPVARHMIRYAGLKPAARFGGVGLFTNNYKRYQNKRRPA